MNLRSVAAGANVPPYTVVHSAPAKADVERDVRFERGLGVSEGSPIRQLLRTLCLQRQRMQDAAHLPAEGAVDQLVLLDPVQAVEG